VIAAIALGLAALPLMLSLDNLRRYRPPPPATATPRLSVLIPARNEENNIGAAVAAVLASRDADLELIVMDDGSTDATAGILAAIGDPRLRVAQGGSLPAGWSGKQHACARLADLARNELLVFVDADVRLAPDALNRIAGFMERHDVALASGFPREITVGWSEILLLPLIHFLLLGYLPMVRMQSSGSVGLGAGCGQLMIARAAAYRAAGGHAAIRASMHDGLMLPRAFRRAGFMTGLFDATDIATCRMYSSAAQVWEGLSKNATEGMAKPLALPVWTVILGGGAILPWLLLLSRGASPVILAACACGLLTRLILARRFRQSMIGAVLHPFGVGGVLVVQWTALVRAALGRKATWRGRAYTVQS
jgi:hypothetical protein